jgi:hypothetical protein
MTIHKHYYVHQGALLKSYITENKLNSKGGVGQLAKILGITRQGVYKIYTQKEIREVHKNKLIEHFDLPSNFFTEMITFSPPNTALIIELQRQLIETKGSLIEAQKRINELSQ